MTISKPKLPLLHAAWLAVLLGVGCTTWGPPNRFGAPAERISPGDAVEVTFRHYPDLNQTLLVPENGVVELMGAGNLSVTGLTPAETAHRVRQAYGRWLAVPDLTVTVRKPAEFTVYVGGDIVEPGQVAFEPKLTVARAIMAKGGLRSGADEYDIFIFRKTGKQGLRRIKLWWTRRAGQDNANKNLRLQPFDVVYVVKATPGTHRGVEI